MEQKIKSETEADMECFIHLIIGEVACHETEVERQIKQGKAFAEHNKSVFEVAMAVANFFDEQLQMKMDAIRELEECNAALKRQLDKLQTAVCNAAKDIVNEKMR